jgi:hypothetical protein
LNTERATGCESTGSWVSKKGLFEPFIDIEKKGSFYQDRLGTNIWNTPDTDWYYRCSCRHVPHPV